MHNLFTKLIVKNHNETVRKKRNLNISAQKKLKIKELK